MTTITALTASNIQTTTETQPSWAIHEHGSFQTQAVTSFDELMAKLKMGGMRPAFLTSEGLYVKNSTPKTLSFTWQN